MVAPNPMERPDIISNGPLSPVEHHGDGTPPLARLLRMADAYWNGNAIHHAIDLYFRIVRKYPDTPEAEQARNRLLEIGEHYEAMGEMHQAMSIYDQLV